MGSARLAGMDTGWQMLSDAEVIDRVRGGETALYEIIMRRYNQRLYRIARVILRDDAEAEDVMQDAYVRAYEHLHEFAGEAKFATWLTKIAVHEALARVRRRARMMTIDDSPGTTIPVIERALTVNADPERAAAGDEMRTLLENAIDSLPDGYRSVFLLRVVEGMSVAETAASLSVGEETVKTRLHRARAQLRDELERRAGVVAAEAFPFHLSRCDRVVQAVLQRIG